MADLWKYYRAQSDTDAETFFAACVTAGTTLSAGQKTAIYNLVGGMKQTGLWTKMTALYPFVGGTAGCHAINLKTPGTYNITWTAAPTQNSNGVTFNGSTQYGDTGIIPSTALTQTSTHLSFYRRTFSAGASYDIGCSNGTDGCFILSRSGGVFRVSLNNPVGTPDGITLSPIDLTGMFIGTRTAASVQAGYIRSRLRLSGTVASNTPIGTRSLYIGAVNSSGTATNFSDGNYAFASVGTGLSATDAQNLSLLVQSYQSALGRAV